MSSKFDLFREFFASQDPSSSAFQSYEDDETTHLFALSLNSFNSMIEWTKGATNSRGEAFRLIPGFLSVMEPNALADRNSENFFAAMNVALFASISEFAMFCFAQRDFFPEIGDSEMEISPGPLGEYAPGIWLFDRTKKGGKVQREHSEKLPPRCPVRYTTSLYLAHLMARFVWFHELCHCFQGHIDFVRDRGIALRLYEVASNLNVAGQTSTGHAETLQLLEYEADRSAFWASLRIQTDGHENIEGIINLGATISQQLTLFGVYATTWLFEEYQNYLDLKANLSHPSPYLRLHNLLNVAQQNMPPHIEDFAAMNGRVCRAFDAIRNKIPKLFGSQDLYRDMEDEKIQAALSRAEEAIVELRPDLVAFEFSEVGRARGEAPSET